MLLNNTKTIAETLLSVAAICSNCDSVTQTQSQLRTPLQVSLSRYLYLRILGCFQEVEVRSSTADRRQSSLDLFYLSEFSMNHSLTNFIVHD